MHIIDQIEIKNFRSFGNRIKVTNKLTKCQPLNIISGANDSGKSNILRALNLFFNKNTNLNQFFNFEKDFFKKEGLDENEIKEELITIKLWFKNPKNSGKNREITSKIHLPEKFWVSRKWKKTSEYSQYDQLSSVEKEFEKEKGEHFKEFLEDEAGKKIKSNVRASLTKQLTDFFSSIQFHYIPAIKDSSYFAHLYGELQQTLWKTKLSSVEKSKDAFEKAIQTETNQLMSEFKALIKLDGNQEIEPVFQLPSDLINLFRALVVQTGNVDLTLRGDGFQAKLIPEILNFIAVKENSFTTNSIKSQYKAKKYFIWGFEEPENSYEYRNAKFLAEKFKDIYSENAQIFITTHSFNFLSLRGSNIETFRVWKEPETNSSKISKVKYDEQGRFKFDSTTTSDWEILQDELGFFYLNEELNKLYEEKRKQVEFIKDQVKEINKPIIYSEGHNYKFLSKAKEIYYPDLEIDILDAGGKNELQKIFKLFAKTSFDRFKIFFIFDCDATGTYSDCETLKTNSLIPIILPQNPNNTISELQSGIENMFDEEIYLGVNEYELFDINEHSRNGVLTTRDRKPRKDVIATIILETRNNPDDFNNFELLFNEINQELEA